MTPPESPQSDLEPAGLVRYQILTKNLKEPVQANPSGNYVKYRDVIGHIDELKAKVDQYRDTLQGLRHTLAIIANSHNPGNAQLARQAIINISK